MSGDDQDQIVQIGGTSDPQSTPRVAPAGPPSLHPEAGATRRDVLDAAIVGGALMLGGSALYPVARFISAPASQDNAALEAVAAKASDVPKGTAVAFRFGSKPALLVRDQEDKLHAFIAICTHLSCVVAFRQDLGHIWCACHNGHYDLTGHNIQGPPPRPLDRLQVELRGEDVVVRRA